MQLILASKSPRRCRILRDLGCKFTIEESRYVEDNELPMHHQKLARYHALAKAKDVAGRHRSGIVLGADTLVVHKSKVHGKPRSHAGAVKMLLGYSGQKIAVITGMALIDIGKNRTLTDSEVTYVEFSRFDIKLVEWYAGLLNLRDKAGSFSVSGPGAILVKRIEGCYYNVLGLPVFKLENMLNLLGHSIAGTKLP